MGKKLDYIEVKKYIEENSKCKLISTEYVNAKTKLSLRCYCGNLFEVNLNKFKNQNQRQCQECGKEILFSQRRVPIERIRKEINDRGATLISETYKANNIPIEIRCKCGKIFKRYYSNIQQSTGEIRCRSCISIENNLLTIEYVKNFIEANTDCILISDEYINCRKSLKIKCSCGNVFKRNWNNFYNNNQRRCDKCANVQSKGELKIEGILLKNDIEFISEYRFENCKYKRKLPFDFYLPKYNLVIEYDGELHFKETALFDLKAQQKRDNIKNEFCKENNINLLRIKYSDFDNLENIIINYLANTEVIS